MKTKAAVLVLLAVAALFQPASGIAQTSRNSHAAFTLVRSALAAIESFASSVAGQRTLSSVRAGCSDPDFLDAIGRGLLRSHATAPASANLEENAEVHALRDEHGNRFDVFERASGA